MSETVDASCPVCGRELVAGPSVNRHHLIPKLKGGKEAFWVHKICHSKLHSLWTEVELARIYNNWETIRADERVQDFVRWLAKKPPDFVGGNRIAKTHRRPRRKR